MISAKLSLFSIEVEGVILKFSIKMLPEDVDSKGFLKLLMSGVLGISPKSFGTKSMIDKYLKVDIII
jgi:hypothetical protein